MKLYDFLAMSECDYDTFDDVFDECVTATINLEPEDDYDNFCIKLYELVEVKGYKENGDPICGWTDLIRRNMDIFRKFANDNWFKNNYQDEDDFICEWIKELHLLLAGYGEDGNYDFYTEQLLDKCDSEKTENNFDVTGEKRENLLMETAMRIMEIFCDMYYSQHVNPDKVDETDSLERLQIFSNWAREFESEFYGTDSYEDDFIGLSDEWATKKIKNMFC